MGKRKRKRKKSYTTCLICQSPLKELKRNETRVCVPTSKAPIGSSWTSFCWCFKCNKSNWYRVVKTETKPYDRYLATDVEEADEKTSVESEANLTVSQYSRWNSYGINDYTKRQSQRNRLI